MFCLGEPASPADPALRLFSSILKVQFPKTARELLLEKIAPRHRWKLHLRPRCILHKIPSDDTPNRSRLTNRRYTTCFNQPPYFAALKYSMTNGGCRLAKGDENTMSIMSCASNKQNSAQTNSTCKTQPFPSSSQKKHKRAPTIDPETCAS